MFWKQERRRKGAERPKFRMYCSVFPPPPLYFIFPRLEFLDLNFSGKQASLPYREEYSAQGGAWGPAALAL